MENFGKKIRILRKQRGMTLKQLAKALGVASFSYVCDIELGNKTPRPRLIVKLADIFGVTTDLLMRDELEIKD